MERDKREKDRTLYSGVFASTLFGMMPAWASTYVSMRVVAVTESKRTVATRPRRKGSMVRPIPEPHFKRRMVAAMFSQCRASRLVCSRFEVYRYRSFCESELRQ